MRGARYSGLYANILMEIFDFINPGFDCSNMEHLRVSYNNLMIEIENYPKNQNYINISNPIVTYNNIIQID